MSLTGCLSKAGEFLPASDKSALMARALELAEQGMPNQQAAQQAVNERIVAVQAELGRGITGISASTRRPERVDPFELSTRQPKATASKTFVPEDAKANLLVSDFAAGLQQPTWLSAVADLVTKYPNYRDAATATTPERQLERLIKQMTDNLTWLHDQVKPEIRDRSKLWYKGGRALAEKMAEKYNISPAQASGILAALSPQKDWFTNITLANRVASTMAEQQDFAWSKDMTQTADRIYADAKYQEDVDAVRGKALGELENDYLRSLWLRAYDEAHNPREFMIVSPEGDDVAPALTQKGAPAKPAWGSLPTIAKAISIFRNGSAENIGEQLGNKHKVRNFYNNIFLPDSPNGHVTIDTHAVAAALVRPLSGNSLEVMHNFGGPSNTKAGLEGSYALYEEAYRRAAQQRNVLPREMQSITWEAVRGLFSAGFKAQAQNVENIDKIWNQYHKGRITYAAARQQALDAAGGITEPSWAGRNPGLYAEEEASLDGGNVSSDELPGSQPGQSGRRGDRSDTGRPGRRAAEAKRSTGRDGSGRDAGGRLAPLEGAPSVRGFHGPDPRIVSVAERYATDNGIDLKRQDAYVEVDTERAARIADAYEQMAHAPNDPTVKAAYADLIKQTTAQYEALAKAGYKFHFIDLDSADGQAYASTPWNAMRDTRENQRMGVFSTVAGFGSDQDFSPEANPLLADTGLMWPMGGEGGTMQRVLANDLFRAVHDAFGHGMEGSGFRDRGEENAWQAHVRLFTGPAVGAITSETRGQNSWLNYGPQGEANRNAKVEDTVFADQKTGLMPEWTWAEGRAGDAKMSTPRDRESTPEFKAWYGDWSKQNERTGSDGRGAVAVPAVQRDGAVGAGAGDAAFSWPIRFPGASGPVGADGRPAVLYHGTRSDITAFDLKHPGRKDHGWLGEGVYLTTDDWVADQYASMKRGDNGPTIMPLYAAVKRPYLATQEEKNKLSKGGPAEAAAFTQRLKRQGHDGVALFNKSGSVEVVAFEPTQVKSATGNNGNYDGAKADITQSKRRDPEAIRAGADEIARLPKATLEDLYPGDAPGGYYAYALYEARKLLPKPSDKLKKVTDNNSLTLWQDNEWIANVDDRLYGITKDEDPDYDPYGTRDEVEEDDNDGAPAAVETGKWNYTFYPLDNPDQKPLTTWHFDKAELIKDIRASADAKRSTMRDGGETASNTKNSIAGDKALAAAGLDITSSSPWTFDGDILQKNFVAKDVDGQVNLTAWFSPIPDTNGRYVLQIEDEQGNDIDEIIRSTQRPVFYSQLEKAIAGVPDRLATMAAPQWKLWLDANAGKMGVKKDEIEWSGIKDYLNLRGKDKVTREEVGAFLKEGGVKTTEQASLDITPAMREKLKTEGVPLFSTRRDQTETEAFKKWFGDSVVTDTGTAAGKPITVYRGEHGDTQTQFQTRGSLTFSANPDSASLYAEHPNSDDEAVLPRVIPVFLSIKNPFFNDADPFIDLAHISRQLGRPEMERIAKEYAAEIKSTSSWEENFSEEYRTPIEAIRGGGSLVDMYFELYHLLDQPHEVEKIKSLGYDGAVYGGSGATAHEKEYRIFNEAQAKSATGNNGNFDGTKGDITESKVRDGEGAWDMPETSKFDDFVYKMQNKMIDTKRVIEALGPIDDERNVYLQEELFHGRAAKQTADFGNDELKPLMEKMAAAKVTMAGLEEYLHAKHAREANRVIAERNPDSPDLQDGGSGMTNAAAAAYLAALPTTEKAVLAGLAGDVRKILNKTRQMYADYGLESQDKVDGWAGMFEHYIPLQREDKDGNGSGMGMGQGFSVKGKEVKGRTGSKRKVVDIIGNIAMQRERLIVRGEKNRVAMALVGLATANPNKEFWSVGAPPADRVYDPKTNTVVERVDPMFKARDNVLVAKIRQEDGSVVEQAVVFKEDQPRAVRMAMALKNLDAGNLEGLLGIGAKITRYFAAINTQYNPVFGVVNLIRDVQGAMVNLGGTPLAKSRTRIAKDTLSAIRGIYSDMRSGDKSSKWSDLWDQFQNEGGQTGYRELFRTGEDRANELKKTLNPDGWMDSPMGKLFTANGALRAPMSAATKSSDFIFGWLSDYNEAMENGVRLAAFKAGLDQGMSAQQAASLAKNLTVNFNRKGQIGQQAGAVYAFFNASFQGSARMAQALFKMDGGDVKTLRLTDTGKKVVSGGLILGSMQALALAAAGFDDEDPPEFLRERSLIIPTGGKTYVTIPMPLGLHVIPGLGRNVTEFALSGFKDPAKRVISMTGMFVDAFNPIGSAGWSMQTLAPTALDPLVALTENRDWTGKPIARTSSNPATPGHALRKDTASEFSKFMSEAINSMSGGSEYTAGALSFTPDQLDYLLAQVGGGVWREFSKVEQTTLGAIRGETVPTFKIPLVGRFVGNAGSQASEGTAFYANVQKANAVETEVKGMRKDGKNAEAQALMKSKPEGYLIAQANAAERQIQALRREKRVMLDKGADREEIKAIELKITAVMARLNRAADQLREKQSTE